MADCLRLLIGGRHRRQAVQELRERSWPSSRPILPSILLRETFNHQCGPIGFFSGSGGSTSGIDPDLDLPTHALALARLRLASTAGCDVTVVHATALSRSTPGTLLVSPAAVSHKLIFGMVPLGGGCNIMDSCHGRQKHLRGSDGQGRQHLYTKQGVSSVLKPHKILSSQTAPRRYLDPLRSHAALCVEIDTCKPPTQKPQPPSHRPFIDMSYLTQRRRPAQENQI